jgi:hypothetical protein
LVNIDWDLTQALKSLTGWDKGIKRAQATAAVIWDQQQAVIDWDANLNRMDWNKYKRCAEQQQLLLLGTSSSLTSQY